MSDQPEVGRPHYTAGGGAPSAGGHGSGTGTGPRLPAGGARIELRAILALGAALFAWSSWTPYYNLPIIAALIAAFLAARWGAVAKRNIVASDGARVGALAADAARALGLADMAVVGYLLFHYYFVVHVGAKGVLTLLFT